MFDCNLEDYPLMNEKIITCNVLLENDGNTWMRRIWIHDELCWKL